jgi:hypothetical protein
MQENLNQLLEQQAEVAVEVLEKLQQVAEVVEDQQGLRHHPEVAEVVALQVEI